MTGQGELADLLKLRFRKACERIGFGGRERGLDTTQFKAPRQDGQQSLFD
jgi:hypothetical protein